MIVINNHSGRFQTLDFAAKDPLDWLTNHFNITNDGEMFMSFEIHGAESAPPVRKSHFSTNTYKNSIYVFHFYLHHYYQL